MLTRRDDGSPSTGSRWPSTPSTTGAPAQFAVDPVGVKERPLLLQRQRHDDSWTRSGTLQVVRDAEGWRAEFGFPFSQLRFSSGRRPVGIAFPRELRAPTRPRAWP